MCSGTPYGGRRRGSFAAAVLTETTMIKLILRGLVLTSFALGMMACNTVKGVGKDIKKAGETIEETAEKHD